MTILASWYWFFVFAIPIIITNGQKQTSAANVGNNSNKTIEAVFGTLVCQGKTLINQRMQKDSEYCNKVAEMDLPGGSANKKSKKGQSKKKRKNAMKCTLTCLWKLWGLTEDNKTTKKTNSLISEVFSEGVRQKVLSGLERCTSDEPIQDDRKQFDSCTEHLHIIRCFKNIIKQACTGTESTSGIIIVNANAKETTANTGTG